MKLIGISRIAIEKARLKNNKPVIQYDKNMNFIKEWKSIREASDNLRIHHGNIGECCRKERKSAGGFKWKYKEEVKCVM